nr:hypothetical protein [Tanacetum cinerariifolium]
MNDSMIELRETFQAWLQQQEQVVNLDSYTPEPSQCQKIPIYYDDDDDEESSTPLRDIIIFELPPMCDVPFCENSHPLDALKDQSEIFFNPNDDSASSDDDPLYSEDINYVEASPLDSKPVSLEEVKDEILHEKLLKIHFLIAKIESLNDHPTPDRMLKSPSLFPIPVEDSNSFFEKFDTSLSYSDNSLPEFETFSDHMEETSSGSTTTHADNSLPEDKIICNLNKTPDLSQRPPQNCPKCGNPIDGHYCQACALLRKELKEVWFTICDEYGIFHDFQDTSKPSNDNTNVVNAPQEPFVVKQELEDILELFRRLHNDVQNIHKELEVYINTLSWDRPTICYNDDDDEDCAIAITPILSTEEPNNSLSMGDEHLDTIPETELDKLIKSSVENLVPIPSESEGIPDNMCDVPFNDNPPPLDISKDQFEDFFESNEYSTSTDENSFSIDDIEYVKASPPDSELVTLEVMEIVIPEVGGIDEDILLTIKDDILCEKLLNINLLIANIEALKDNPTSYSDFMTNSSPLLLTFS